MALFYLCQKGTEARQATEIQMFYHAHVAGFMKQTKTLSEVQNWLDRIRPQVAGETLTVHRVIDNLVEKKPCVSGPVSK